MYSRWNSRIAAALSKTREYAKKYVKISATLFRGSITSYHHYGYEEEKNYENLQIHKSTQESLRLG
jgi:hypothetical protein